ncbi:MAG: diguanylate cyclase [Thermodesulfobacteriota bacterium]
MSTHDALSGLHRMGLFRAGDLQAGAREAELPVSMIIADVNWLKRANDSMGHQAGDELLKRAADI